MKRVLITAVAIFSIFMLGACSNDNLDGSYYEYDREELYLRDDPDIVIEGTVGKRSNETFTVDTEEKEFSANGYVLPYVYENGVLTVDGETYVQKGTDAYNEAKKANSKRLQEISDKERSELEKVKENLNGKYYEKEKYTNSISNEPSFEIVDSNVIVYNLKDLEAKKYDLTFEDSKTIKIGNQIKYSISYNDEDSVLSLGKISVNDGKKYYGESVQFVEEQEKNNIDTLKSELSGKFYLRNRDTEEISKTPSFEISDSKILVYDLKGINNHQYRSSNEYKLTFVNSHKIIVGSEAEYIVLYRPETKVLEMAIKNYLGDGKSSFGKVEQFVKK